MKILSLAFLFFFLSSPAHACERGPLKPAEAIEYAKNAYYVGKVRVISINTAPEFSEEQAKIYYDSGDYPAELILESVEAYKGAPFKELKVYDFFRNNCSKGLPTVGQVYEEVITSQDITGFVVQTKYTSFLEETWRELRPKTKDIKDQKE